MDKIKAFFDKLVLWLKANLGTVLGATQAILKGIKEILTGVMNLLSIVMPAAKAQEIVMKIRDFINVIDAKIEEIKDKVLESVVNL